MCHCCPLRSVWNVLALESSGTGNGGLLFAVLRLGHGFLSPDPRTGAPASGPSDAAGRPVPSTLEFGDLSRQPGSTFQPIGNNESRPTRSETKQERLVRGIQGGRSSSP